MREVEGRVGKADGRVGRLREGWERHPPTLPLPFPQPPPPFPQPSSKAVGEVGIGGEWSKPGGGIIRSG